MRRAIKAGSYYVKKNFFFLLKKETHEIKFKKRGKTTSMNDEQFGENLGTGLK